MIYSVNNKRWYNPDDYVTKHFKFSELADKIDPIVFIDMIFMRDMVEPLRMAIGVPFVINSACRSISTNTRVKGHPRSLHLMFNPHHKYKDGTLALDISSEGWDDSTKREFIRVAHKLGLSVGSHPNFFHIDGRILAGLSQATFKY